MRMLCISGIYEEGGALRLSRGLIGDVTEEDVARANLPDERVITLMTFDEQGDLLGRSVLPARSLCALPGETSDVPSKERYLIGGLTSVPEGARLFRFFWEGALVHEFARPQRVPQVQFTWTPPSEALRGRHLVTWEARFSETLSYFVFVERGDQDRRPVFIGEEPKAEIDFDQLPSGSDMRFRVVASDGFHNAAAVSPPFSVARKAPSVIVAQPATDMDVPFNQPVLMEGAAWSADTGLLPDHQLRWLSDKDGELGYGRRILARLSRGVHVVTLVAVDGTATQPVSREIRLTVR